ncbi:hypothetical protein EYR40_000430 [Pleurotus pulmonarius]|nr:hypothetical protein EYR40_000430 [Pleurotus pulmonarius]
MSTASAPIASIMSATPDASATPPIQPAHPLGNTPIDEVLRSILDNLTAVTTGNQATRTQLTAPIQPLNRREVAGLLHRMLLAHQREYFTPTIPAAGVLSSANTLEFPMQYLFGLPLQSGIFINATLAQQGSHEAKPTAVHGSMIYLFVPQNPVFQHPTPPIDGPDHQGEPTATTTALVPTNTDMDIELEDRRTDPLTPPGLERNVRLPEVVDSDEDGLGSVDEQADDTHSAAAEEDMELKYPTPTPSPKQAALDFIRSTAFRTPSPVSQEGSSMEWAVEDEGKTQDEAGEDLPSQVPDESATSLSHGELHNNTHLVHRPPSQYEHLEVPQWTTSSPFPTRTATPALSGTDIPLSTTHSTSSEESLLFSKPSNPNSPVLHAEGIEASGPVVPQETSAPETSLETETQDKDTDQNEEQSPPDTQSTKEDDDSEMPGLESQSASADGEDEESTSTSEYSSPEPLPAPHRTPTIDPRIDFAKVNCHAYMMFNILLKLKDSHPGQSFVEVQTDCPDIWGFNDAYSTFILPMGVPIPPTTRLPLFSAKPPVGHPLTRLVGGDWAQRAQVTFKYAGPVDNHPLQRFDNALVDELDTSYGVWFDDGDLEIARRITRLCTSMHKEQITPEMWDFEYQGTTYSAMQSQTLPKALWITTCKFSQQTHDTTSIFTAIFFATLTLKWYCFTKGFKQIANTSITEILVQKVQLLELHQEMFFSMKKKTSFSTTLPAYLRLWDKDVLPMPFDIFVKAAYTANILCHPFFTTNYWSQISTTMGMASADLLFGARKIGDMGFATEALCEHQSQTNMTVFKA